jgi:hypothetical protein
MKEPWDVKYTPEGREQLLRLVEEYEASGQSRELGLTLSRLARLAKQIGMGEGSSGFVESARYGAWAVDVLRQTGDKKALASALRAAAVPLVTNIQPVELLTEALEISRSIGDQEGEGWAIFILANSFFMHPHGFTLDDAIAVFRAGDCKVGLATCLQSQAVKAQNGRWAKLMAAKDLFREAGHPRQALRAVHMACAIDFEDTSLEVRLAALEEALAMSREIDEPKEEAMTFRLMRNLFLETDPARAAHYAGEEGRLDERVYGSRKGRLEYEIEGQREMLDFADRREKKAIRAEIARFEAELANLE